MDPVDASNRSSISTWAILGITLVLIAGATFRLIWPADMEYKGDEIYSFEKTQHVGVSQPWPWVGMNNSADVPHPGMSVWVFLGLGKLINAHDPTDLNLACMGLNVIALLLFASFIATVVPRNEQEPWWWGLALLSVNPLAVVFHRKIWPPSVLPAISVLMLWTWWFRSRRSSAFAFGLIAALAAQIHPGAFFFTAGLALWVVLFDRASWRWIWSALGGLVGAVTAIPWIYHLAFVVERSAAEKSHWWRLFELKFWVYWLTEPFGLSLQYSLGEDFATFLSGPILSGHATYIVAALHAILIFLAMFILVRYFATASRTGNWGFDRRQTGLLIGAIGIGYGLVLTITGLPVYRHYLIVAAPIACVAVARVALIGLARVHARRLLSGLIMVQATVTSLFLVFIHNVEQPIRGDYGAPYRVQRINSNLHSRQALNAVP